VFFRYKSLYEKSFDTRQQAFHFVFSFKSNILKVINSRFYKKIAFGGDKK